MQVNEGEAVVGEEKANEENIVDNDGMNAQEAADAEAPDATQSLSQ